MKTLTREQWRKFNRATTCHICLNEFKEDDIQVRDHCHYTGKYRGPAHGICNLRYRIPNYILIVFHNLSGHDAHLFIKELGKKFNIYGQDRSDCREEKYISLNVDVQ